AVNVQRPKDQGGAEVKAVYIDTEGTFRPDRIKQLAEGIGAVPEKVLKNMVSNSHTTDKDIIPFRASLEEDKEKRRQYLNNVENLKISSKLKKRIKEDEEQREKHRQKFGDAQIYQPHEVVGGTYYDPQLEDDEWIIREKIDAREEYKEYLKRPHWQKTRLKKLESVGWQCESCGDTETELHVHHLTYKTKGRERLKDLKVLCRHCHTDAEANKY
ncbi:MAG: HNH endonuclease, partial [Candidatus Diapherotrites archaeon]|nr:HNH endonuclease [Candidatus Diapherotrites archaeon]